MHEGSKKGDYICSWWNYLLWNEASAWRDLEGISEIKPGHLVSSWFDSLTPQIFLLWWSSNKQSVALPASSATSRLAVDSCRREDAGYECTSRCHISLLQPSRSINTIPRCLTSPKPLPILSPCSNPPRNPSIHLDNPLCISHLDVTDIRNHWI